MIYARDMLYEQLQKLEREYSLMQTQATPQPYINTQISMRARAQNNEFTGMRAPMGETGAHAAMEMNSITDAGAPQHRLTHVHLHPSKQIQGCSELNNTVPSHVMSEAHARGGVDAESSTDSIGAGDMGATRRSSMDGSGHDNRSGNYPFNNNNHTNDIDVVGDDGNGEGEGKGDEHEQVHDRRGGNTDRDGGGMGDTINGNDEDGDVKYSVRSVLKGRETTPQKATASLFKTAESVIAPSDPSIIRSVSSSSSTGLASIPVNTLTAGATGRQVPLVDNRNVSSHASSADAMDHKSHDSSCSLNTSIDLILNSRGLPQQNSSSHATDTSSHFTLPSPSSSPPPPSTPSQQQHSSSAKNTPKRKNKINIMF